MVCISDFIYKTGPFIFNFHLHAVFQLFYYILFSALLDHPDMDRKCDTALMDCFLVGASAKL